MAFPVMRRILPKRGVYSGRAVSISKNTAHHIISYVTAILSAEYWVYQAQGLQRFHGFSRNRVFQDLGFRNVWAPHTALLFSFPASSVAFLPQTAWLLSFPFVTRRLRHTLHVMSSSGDRRSPDELDKAAPGS